MASQIIYLEFFNICSLISGEIYVCKLEAHLAIHTVCDQSSLDFQNFFFYSFYIWSYVDLSSNNIDLFVLTYLCNSKSSTTNMLHASDKDFSEEFNKQQTKNCILLRLKQKDLFLGVDPILAFSHLGNGKTH